MSDNEENTDISFSGGTIGYEAHGNLYLNITNKCSANCYFCVRESSDGVYGYNLRLSKEPSYDEIIKELEQSDLKKYNEIVFTGLGEPTCRLETVLDVTRWLHERGVRVRLDTNGHAKLMYPETDVVTELKNAGLDSVSVSLNAESEEKYEKICKPSLKNAYDSLIDFTKEAIEAGIATRMTVVGMPEIDIGKCEKIARDLGAGFRVR
ncbi:TatD family nuclease-associated radical SAM protein [Methanolobus halotolerans]|uniref:Metallo cofactor biosynthesis protein n=1 Tax=Methanolobus halotolerans TaxID=2052935 RepID=A0A4E0QA45_9EURY|nr:TatD family nuclease-associated radical SAM protein [Methanolobus halotolerans]TGC09172.1 metallo cofactor biosynthesis protein [Methanolobus halotolerans]